MGWNQGWTIMEETVIGAYDLGKLDKALLSVLLEPYRDTDIDSGGKQGTLSRDGKDVEQIVIETWGLEIPEPPDVPQPDWRKWQEWSAQEEEDSRTWEDYNERIDALFDQVTREHGW